MHIQLPRDIKVHLFLQFAKKLLICVTAWCILLIVCQQKFSQIVSYTSLPMAVLLISIIALLPLYFTKIYQYAYKRSFCGIITNIHLEYVERTKNPLRQNFMNQKGLILEWAYCIVTLSVTLPNGKTKTFEAERRQLTTGDDAEKLANHYTKGETVYHIQGLSYPLTITAKGERKPRCLLCGEWHSPTDITCKNCHHTLIK